MCLHVVITENIYNIYWGGCGQKQLCGCGHPGHKVNGWINWANFCMLIHGARKAKSYFGCAHGQIWLWPFASWDSKIFFYLKNKLMNWADFLHAGGNVIIFGYTTNHALYDWCLNTGAPLSCICYLLRCLVNFGLPQSLSHGQ